MERDQASKFINDLLRLMVSRSGSDLFITAEFPPAIKVDSLGSTRWRWRAR
jgi:twitching motility protein PilU